MKKLTALLIAAWFPVAAPAAESGGTASWWEQPNVNVEDKASLQRGAQLFVNYCMGCHGAKYHRWMHVSEDLAIPEDVVQNNLIWTTGPNGKKDRVGTLMTNAFTREYGQQVFGKPPPDLTLTARSEGPAWIYNYLQTFYIDESSPTGVDNAVLSGASMPHVLWPLQGWQRPIYEEAAHGPGKHITGFELVEEGSMTPEQYDRAVNDLVNFMVYLGEPARLDRLAVGGWVLLFLIVFLLLAYLLKKEYWKDVH